MFIAVVGCGHGEIDKIYEVVSGIEKERHVKVSLVLCCGDFQSVRNMTDLRCMACPVKYQQMHDFHRYYSGEKEAPIPTVFIGGNHEASNFLQELPYGGWVAPNIFFLGSNVVRFGKLRIAGVSGIFKGHDYLKGKFESPPYDHSSMRSVYHYRNIDTFRLKQVKGRVDIVLSHDWPRSIHTYGDTLALLRRKPFLRDEIGSDSLGSRPLAELLHHLKPPYWFSAHMHVKFSAVVPHEPNHGMESDGAPKSINVTKFLALDKILPRRQFLQIIEVPDGDDDDSRDKLYYDAEWLAILKSTNSLLSVKASTCYMPGPNPMGERYDFAPTEAEIEDVSALFEGNLEIPLNFEQTAPPYEVGQVPGTAFPMENPQTSLLCSKLGISDHIRLISSSSYGKWRNHGDPLSGEGSPASDSTTPSTTSFTAVPQNPDEICLDDEEESVEEVRRGKMSLPPPREEEGGAHEEAALDFLLGDAPLFVLDKQGEPERKKWRGPGQE